MPVQNLPKIGVSQDEYNKGENVKQIVRGSADSVYTAINRAMSRAGWQKLPIPAQWTALISQGVPSTYIKQFKTQGYTPEQVLRYLQPMKVVIPSELQVQEESVIPITPPQMSPNKPIQRQRPRVIPPVEQKDIPEVEAVPQHEHNDQNLYALYKVNTLPSEQEFSRKKKKSGFSKIKLNLGNFGRKLADFRSKTIGQLSLAEAIEGANSDGQQWKEKVISNYYNKLKDYIDQNNLATNKAFMDKANSTINYLNNLRVHLEFSNFARNRAHKLFMNKYYNQHNITGETMSSADLAKLLETQEYDFTQWKQSGGVLNYFDYFN